MTYPCRVLVLFAHPAFHKSRVQRGLVHAARSVDGITFHDLYEEYYDFQLDAAREQKLLDTHDVIVFQHPFFWYSAPAILKEWQDLVLEYGYAFGEGGTALHGKRLMSVLSAGGSEEAYAASGANKFTVQQLLVPFEQTARLCGMEYLPPFVVHDSRCQTQEQIRAHADQYARLLTAIRDGTFDWDRARTVARLNADLTSLLSAAPADRLLRDAI